MEPSRYRVIQWATGQVGIEQLRGILDHPRLELVGVRVYGKDKEGVDAGDLCGRETVGIQATRDVGALLEVAADCVSFGANEVHGVDAVLDEQCRILTSGKNLTGVTGTQLVHPPLLPDVTARLEQACRIGGTSMYVGGLHPGFMDDILPAALSSGCQNIESISNEEFIDVSAYTDPVFVRDGCGFGATREADAEMADIRLNMAEVWLGSGTRNLTDALQVEIDDVQPFREVVLSDDTFDVAACRIEKGTVCGINFGFNVFVAGKPRITLSNYLRVASDPQDPWPNVWPLPPGGRGGYRVDIKGVPTMRVDVCLGSDVSDALTDALIFTGMRTVNAIPAVCEAAPGLHTFLTLGQQVFGSTTWRC